MTINLDQTTVKIFESEVKEAFQQKGELRQTVRVKDAKNAKQVEFRVYGKGAAKKRTTVHTPLEVMNVNLEPKVATVENWYASELTDIFLQNQVDFDERQKLVNAVKMALERRLDQIIIDAMEDYTIPGTVAVSVGGADTNLRFAKIREFAKILGKNSVPAEARTLLMHTNNLHALLGETEATSSDYSNIQALIKGDLKSFYGFNIVVLGDRAEEGGLPLSGANVRSIYAYHKDSVGLAVNMEPKITIDWDPTYGAHRVTGFLSAGAVIIDDEGIVEGSCDEDDVN